MTISRSCLGALPLLALLAACVRSDPPSGQLERAAEEMVTEVGNELLPAQPSGRYAPRNECLDLPGAAEFLASLRNATEARDVDALVALSAPDVFLDFGGGAGRAKLRQQLAAPDGERWAALDDILEMGCATEGQRMTLPWYFPQDIGEVDPYGAMIVTGEDVPLYAAATGREELRKLDWDLVTRVSFLEIVEEEGPRSEVELGDGTRGFVDEDKLRSLIDYRIGATRHDGRWQIATFVAGD